MDKICREITRYLSLNISGHKITIVKSYTKTRTFKEYLISYLISNIGCIWYGSCRTRRTQCVVPATVVLRPHARCNQISLFEDEKSITISILITKIDLQTYFGLVLSLNIGPQAVEFRQDEKQWCFCVSRATFTHFTLLQNQKSITISVFITKTDLQTYFGPVLSPKYLARGPSVYVGSKPAVPQCFPCKF